MCIIELNFFHFKLKSRGTRIFQWGKTKRKKKKNSVGVKCALFIKPSSNLGYSLVTILEEK